jgi:hypothetical protein
MYAKADAIRDLIAIIHARSSDAADDNPLCELRMGKNGPYHRFPPKLQAMSRLMKLMGWDQPEKVEVGLKDNFVELLHKVRSGELVPGHADLESTPDTSPSAAESSDGWDPCPAATPFEPESPSLNDAQSPRSHDSTTAPSSVDGYTRDSAVADLVTIIQARPRDASPDHPLCEMRMTSWGPYHRFPMKLAALVLLSRMLGWHQPTQVQVEYNPNHRFKALREFIAERK